MPPLEVPSLPSGARKATAGKPTIAAKGSVKGLTAVTRAKVLVSKAKNVSTKQIAKTTKGAVKQAGVSQMQAAGSSAGATVAAKLPDGGLKTKTVQRGMFETFSMD